MIFLGQKWSDWRSWGSDTGWNYWRQSESGRLIGLIVNSAESFVMDPNACTWAFDTTLGRDGQGLRDLYYSVYGNRKYRYHELEDAKKEIDHLLESMDSLKGFL